MRFNCMIEGRLVRDPKMSITPTGRARTWFTVAHDFGYKAEGGKWTTTSTLFLEVTCWGELAERVDRSIRKGDLVLVDARDLQISQNGEYANANATAANVSLSLRYDGATSERGTTASAPNPTAPEESAWEVPEPDLAEVPF